MPEPMTLEQLLARWNQGPRLARLETVHVLAVESGDHDQADRAALELAVPHVTPLQSLAANAELVRRLLDGQWKAVRDALEGAATWDEIAEAQGLTRDEAVAYYVHADEHRERRAGEPFDQRSRRDPVLGLTTTRRRDACLEQALADLAAAKRHLAEANVALVVAASNALTTAARHERERRALLRRLGVALRGCRRYRREARADARIFPYRAAVPSAETAADPHPST